MVVSGLSFSLESGSSLGYTSLVARNRCVRSRGISVVLGTRLGFEKTTEAASGSQ